MLFCVPLLFALTLEWLAAVRLGVQLLGYA